MSKKIRIYSLILAGLLALPTFAACANEQPSVGESSETVADTVTDTAISTEISTETLPETDPVQDALDALENKVDWGGKDFGMLYANDIGGYTEEVEAEKTKGTVINDAVFQRNILFEETGKLNFVLIPVANGMITTKLNAEVQSGTGDFHLVTQTTSGTASLATAGLLYDYLSLDIDYDDKLWWDQGTLDFALAGKVFFMNGPFNIVDDDVTFIMMFNKQLREDYHVPNLYDTVKKNEWTLDYFNSIISTLSKENGDGRWDEQDTYGFAGTVAIGQSFFYGADLQYIKNNRNMEAPELMLTGSKMERALDVLAMSRKITQENHSSYIGADATLANATTIFVEGRSLFYSEAASYLRALNSGMKTEYGVLPIPKFTTDQEHYTTWSHSIGSTLSIPTSIGKQDLEQFANVLELYAVLSQQYVRPAYYDNMLTVRNVRDAESAEMMDLIFDHRVCDMAMYFTELGFESIFWQSAAYADTFSSSYVKAANTFDKRLNRLLGELAE